MRRQEGDREKQEFEGNCPGLSQIHLGICFVSCNIVKYILGIFMRKNNLLQIHLQAVVGFFSPLHPLLHMAVMNNGHKLLYLLSQEWSKDL